MSGALSLGKARCGRIYLCQAWALQGRKEMNLRQTPHFDHLELASSDWHWSAHSSPNLNARLRSLTTALTEQVA
jgi:hypothetical protein